MSTDKQIEANRRNAQKSTGPRTTEGKESIRLNALKHGLRAEAITVLPGEDVEDFAAQFKEWEEDFRPSNRAEALLVRRVAILSWKLDRADRHENAMLSRRVRDAVESCDCADDDAVALAEAADLASFDASPEGDRLRRYQSAIGREMMRALDELLKQRREREKAEASGRGLLPIVEIKPPTPIEPISPAPNKAISHEIRRECRTRESEKQAPAPNKAIPPPVTPPNKAISTPSSARLIGNRAERKRRMRRERQLGQAHRAEQSHFSLGESLRGHAPSREISDPSRENR